MGFIWNEPEYGKADSKVGTRTVGSFEAFDRSPMVKLMMQQLSGSTGQQQAKAMAQASKIGAGRSSGNIGQLGSIAADTENRVQGARQQAAMETWKDQMDQKKTFDQLAADKYKVDAALYEGEKARRRAPLGIFGQFLS